jgi:glutathione reductase (NADPH)
MPARCGCGTDCARFHDMSNRDYDLVVIGAGSGGLATAKRAASYGVRVAIVESDRVGGTCVIRGCIPKKLMVYAAEHGTDVADAAGYGWSHARGSVDWGRLAMRRDEAVSGLERTHEDHLARAGVTLLHGHARLRSARTVEVGGNALAARYVLVATGAAPVLPAIDGIENALTSDGFFALRTQPVSAAIVGGGYIAVELACILNGLGTRVSLIVRGELPLRGFDVDLRRACADALREQGIDLRQRTTVERIATGANGSRLHLRTPDGMLELANDGVLLYATGRRPRSADLGLEAAGVRIGSQGEILVDEYAETSVPGVFAVGDVTSKKSLTPVAIQAGRSMADRVFGGKDVTMSYAEIPTAVFCEPPIASVGLSEDEARSSLGLDGVKVFKSAFTPLYHTLTARKTKTLVKLVVDAATDRVLGCHMIGRDAPEIIQGFAVAMKAGATKAVFDATVGIHPSAAEELVTLS